MKRLKEKWNIESDFQLVIIFIVFAISGSLSMFISKPLLSIFGINKEAMSPWTFWPLRILIMFVSYYIVLVSVGTIFGQFKFFWGFTMKTFGRFNRRATSNDGK